LKEAHSIKLPKDNIERALKKASDQSGENFSTGYYEVYGHGGVGIIVSTLTDNSNRANMAIKSFAKKSDVKMASSGSVMFNFDHKVSFLRCCF
jgi:transcriptional/translational regulatory protein YebC/TACO1